jgi:hypothetical protein
MQKRMWLRLVVVCLLCAGLVTTLVWLAQRLFS